MRRPRALHWIAAIGWVAASGLAGAVDFSSLAPVPEPPLEMMEPAVRAQLSEARRELSERLEFRSSPTGVPLQDGSSRAAPDLAAAYGILGQLYHGYDLFGAAAACYANAAILAPEDFRWRYYLGVVHQLEGRLEEALAQFSAAAVLRPNHLPILLRLAELEVERGSHASATELYRRVLASNPGSAAAEVGLARISLAAGEAVDAIARLERALELQPRADRVHYLLGQAYRRQGDLERAVEHLQQAGSVQVGYLEPLLIEIRRLSVGASAALGRGGDAQMLGLYDVALAEYRRAVAEAPENADARFAFGSLLVATEALDEAARELSEAVRLDPDQPEPRFLYGHVLFRQRRSGEAEPHLRRALELDPEHREARATLAALLAETGRFGEAIVQYRDLLSDEPDDHEARLGLGKALVMNSENEAGLAEFDRVLREARDEALIAQAHHDRAVLEAAEGSREIALASLNAALELDPALADARRLQARLLSSLGRLEEASRSYDELLAIEPGDASARLEGAGTLIVLGRVTVAREWLQAGLELDPANRALRLALARLLACGPAASERDGVTALALAETLLAEERSLAHAEIVAMALAQSGRFDDAAALQEELTRESRRLGFETWIARLAGNLERYRAGRPCRLEPAPAP